MRHGFIKTAAGTPKIQVADCVYNAGEILKLIRQMETEGAKIMAFRNLYHRIYLPGPVLADTASGQCEGTAGMAGRGNQPGGCADHRRTSMGI